MNPKIMKLRGELEKNKGKISDLQGRNREISCFYDKLFACIFCDYRYS